MPTSFRSASFAALALALSTCAHAATDCDNATSQRDMNQCAATAFQREDTRLNTLYKELVRLSDRKEAARLKQIQLAWVKFRDLHCNYEAGRYQGGSMAPLVASTCLQKLTSQRNDTLQALVKDFH